MNENISFKNGVMFSQNPCDIPGIGHDLENLMTGYDLQGTVAKICPRPFCQEIIYHVAVDDLSRESFDELQEVLKTIAAKEGFNGE